MSDEMAEQYQKIINEIYIRNKGDSEKFSLSDKLVLKQIFGEVREEIYKNMDSYMAIVNYFADMDLNREILNSKQADTKKIEYILGK